MQRLILVALTLAFGSAASAQEFLPGVEEIKLGEVKTNPPPQPGPPQATVPQMTTTVVLWEEPLQPIPRTWVRAEYLLWSLDPARVGVPLVTTGNPASPTGGIFGDPTTRTLFGDANNVGSRFASGSRLALGHWFDDTRTFGIETSGFVLERLSREFAASGSQRLVIPFQNIVTGESGIVIADPATGTRGNVRVDIRNRLWGADVNGVAALWQNDRVAFDGIVGFRYFDFAESQEMTTNSQNAGGLSFSAIERFRTRNQFYGVQLGGRVSGQTGKLSGDFSFLVALGATDQLVSAVGSSNFFGPGAIAPGVRPGFLFTQPTNIGARRSSDFSAIPQFQLKVGYDLTSRIRATFTYDALFWDNVVRPGEQIDRVINLSQASPNLGGGGALVGPARPGPQRNTSDFWAHGVGFGLEFRW